MTSSRADHNYDGHSADHAPGVLASELPTPAFLDRHIAKGQEFSAVVANHSRGSELWLGEFASCAGSGVPGVSDSFESCLWFMDALGSLASQGHAVLARQAIIGGDYELVDKDTWAPNPVNGDAFSICRVFRLAKPGKSHRFRTTG